MNSIKYRYVVAILLLAALAGCTQQQQSPQQIREKTAEATAEAKSDAKAVAEGIREGWNRNKPLDLNTATKEQLRSLPDMTPADADRVVAGRPYNEPDELVTRHILSKTKFDKIADQVTAKK
jgi:DNA uptake protein ComE-like DNA-binding protein